MPKFSWRRDLEARRNARSRKVLLILVWLVAIAACVSLSQRAGDCASAKNTWTGMLAGGVPELNRQGPDFPMKASCRSTGTSSACSLPIARERIRATGS
jgi:hypothetical protein